MGKFSKLISILLFIFLFANNQSLSQSYIYGSFTLNLPEFQNQLYLDRFYLLANPFDNGTNTLSSLIPPYSIAEGTYVNFWNPLTANYITSISTTNQWTTNFYLPPGVGFFIHSPQNMSITFNGKIPVPIGKSVTNNIPAGYNLVGSYIPFYDSLQGTNLNLSHLPQNSSVRLWYGDLYQNGTYNPYMPIYPAEGFFLFASSNFAWIQTLPYPITTNTTITYITNQYQTIQTNIIYTYTTNGNISPLSVTLAWNVVTNVGVTGYNIYYGSSGSHYTNITTVGNVTNTTIGGFNQGYTFYFAATTLAGSLESAYSSEINYTIPILYTITTNSFINYITNISTTITTNISQITNTNANFPFSWYITNTSPIISYIPSVESVHSLSTSGGISLLSTNINIVGNNPAILWFIDWYSSTTTQNIPKYNNLTNSMNLITNFLWYKDSNAHANIWSLKIPTNGNYSVSCSWSAAIDEGSMTIVVITNYLSIDSVITTNLSSSSSKISLQISSNTNELMLLYSVLSDTGHTPTMGTNQTIISQKTTGSGQHQNVISSKKSTNSTDISSVTWSSGSGYPSGTVNFGIKGN